MRGGILALVVVLAAAGCGRTTPVAVGTPVASQTPTATPTPTPTSTPPSTAAKPSAPLSFDLTEAVVRSKLYTAGKVPAVPCVLPRPDLTTRAGMVAYGKVLVTCMDKAWAPLVAKSDAVLVPPEIFAYSLRRPKGTPECVDPPKEARAFYHQSGMSGKICFDADAFLDAQDREVNRVDFEQMIAHEYGHHVQQSVGILTLYNELMRGRSESGQLEVQRRMELQASCLGAAFLGANKRTFRVSGERLRIWRYIVQHAGDEYGEVRDHGSRKNHGYWTIRAFASANPASCNTFTAPAKRVG